MEKQQKIYLALGVLAVAGLTFGICSYLKKNKLPDAGKIKVGADGSSDEVRGEAQKLPSQQEEQEVSNAHGGGGGHHGGGGHRHGGHGGRGGRGRFWGGGWGGWGYPYGFDYPYYDNGLCYQRDAFGNIVSAYCDDYQSPPLAVSLPRRRVVKAEDNLGADAGQIDI